MVGCDERTWRTCHVRGSDQRVAVPPWTLHQKPGPAAAPPPRQWPPGSAARCNQREQLISRNASSGKSWNYEIVAQKDSYKRN
jgi:hypothetical protein